MMTNWSPTFNRVRVQLLLILAIQVALGAHIGSIICSGSNGYKDTEYANRTLCYGHIEFTIETAPPGQVHNKLVVKIHALAYQDR